MKFQHVCLESLGYTLPREVVTSAALEDRLAPVYDRLRLPAGRLELMTGIRERRFFQPNVRLGHLSQQSCRAALAAAEFDPQLVGALVHGSVCRDYLEPATACSVHHDTGLSPECAVYDVSNACLGILTGMIQVANMIELGQIKAGLIVGTECGRSLVDNTIARLNTDESLSRKDIKPLVASLTIGSGSVAVLLCHSKLSRTENRLLAVSVLANTAYSDLCQSSGLDTFMHTDSEQLLQRGVATGVQTFARFQEDSGWKREQINKTVCHQVGVAHRKLLFESLDLDSAMDFSTFEQFGNTGAVALPLTLAVACQQGHVEPSDRVALLGIGSGINCQMMAVEWQRSQVQQELEN